MPKNEEARLVEKTNHTATRTLVSYIKGMKQLSTPPKDFEQQKNIALAIIEKMQLQKLNILQAIKEVAKENEYSDSLKSVVKVISTAGTLNYQYEPDSPSSVDGVVYYPNDRILKAMGEAAPKPKNLWQYMTTNPLSRAIDAAASSPPQVEPLPKATSFSVGAAVAKVTSDLWASLRSRSIRKSSEAEGTKSDLGYPSASSASEQEKNAQHKAGTPSNKRKLPSSLRGHFKSRDQLGGGQPSPKPPLIPSHDSMKKRANLASKETPEKPEPQPESRSNKGIRK